MGIDAKPPAPVSFVRFAAGQRLVMLLGGFDNSTKPRVARFVERIGFRHALKIQRQDLLHMSTIRVRDRKGSDPLSTKASSNWSQPTQSDSPSCGLRCDTWSDEKKTGIIIRYDRAGSLRQLSDQTRSLTGIRFNIRVVQDTGASDCSLIVDHAIDHKAVKAIAGPTIMNSQGLDDDKRFPQLIC